MSELTLVYYTASKIKEPLGRNVRACLVSSSGNKYPIISVSQKPLDFGENICVGDIGQSVNNAMKQVLIGAEAARTRYVALCEDDTLYAPEHFDCRPNGDVYMYNTNYWFIRKEVYFYRERVAMCNCIAPRDMLIREFSDRFAKYPEGIPHVGEPGRRGRRLGLFVGALATFRTREPNVNILHEEGLAGIRHTRKREEKRMTLEPWGDVASLWSRMNE